MTAATFLCSCLASGAAWAGPPALPPLPGEAAQPTSEPKPEAEPAPETEPPNEPGAGAPSSSDPSPPAQPAPPAQRPQPSSEPSSPAPSRSSPPAGTDSAGSEPGPSSAPPVQRPTVQRPTALRHSAPSDTSAPPENTTDDGPIPGPAWEATSSKAPASTVDLAPRSQPATKTNGSAAPPPRVDRSTAAATSDGASLRKSAKRDDPTFEHNGFVLEANVGTMGCTHSICAGGGGHDARPGVAVNGFLGGNIAGFVDVGLTGGWGQLRPRIESGTNGWQLYGIETQALKQAISDYTGAPMSEVPIDDFLAIRGASMSAAQGGFGLRVHFIPRGRMAAFIGSGFDYQLLRSRYQTDDGNLQLDMHGLAVPAQAGLGVYVYDHVALTARFDYRWTHFLAMHLKSPNQQLFAPVSTIDDAATEVGADLQDDLPDFWTVNAGLRVNF